MKSIVISNHEQVMPTGPKTASTGNLRGKPAATCAAMRPNGTWGERGNLLFKRLAFVIAAAKYQPCPVGYVRKRWFAGLAPNNGHQEGWGCNLFSTYEYRRLDVIKKQRHLIIYENSIYSEFFPRTWLVLFSC